MWLNVIKMRLNSAGNVVFSTVVIYLLSRMYKWICHLHDVLPYELWANIKHDALFTEAPALFIGDRWDELPKRTYMK